MRNPYQLICSYSETNPKGGENAQRVILRDAREEKSVFISVNRSRRFRFAEVSSRLQCRCRFKHDFMLVLYFTNGFRCAFCGGPSIKARLFN